ncbi:MAG: flippase-like domain-containing protein, partial [Ktedonobacteraceae bacterium]|nr:flippase-like domain-containing protein [Ktedonobacteraceae bacterium]
LNTPAIEDAILNETIEQKEAELPETSSPKASEITREQLSLGKRLLNWRTLVPLAVVVVLLVVFGLRANIDPKKIWATIQSANMFFFLAAFLTYYCSFFIRALRWRILLQNVGFTRENGIQLPGVWKIVEIIYISFFANSIVPAKLGDLYRAYLLRQEINVSTTRSFATVVAERLLDLSALLLLFIPAIIISLHEHLPSQLQISLEILLGLVITGIVALVILRIARERIARLIPKRLRGHYYHFQEGTLGSFRRLPLPAGLTAGVWICEALRFFFIALSLNLIGGSFLHILAATIVIGLGEALLSAIPTTGGGVGLVEGGMVAMIALYYQGPNLVNLTAAAILLDRMITLFSILLFGSVVFLFAFGRKAASKK